MTCEGGRLPGKDRPERPLCKPRARSKPLAEEAERRFAAMFRCHSEQQTVERDTAPAALPYRLVITRPTDYLERLAGVRTKP